MLHSLIAASAAAMLLQVSGDEASAPPSKSLHGLHLPSADVVNDALRHSGILGAADARNFDQGDRDILYGWAARGPVEKLLNRYPWIGRSRAESLKAAISAHDLSQND